MDDKLHKLRNWIGHGSLHQFYAEVAPKLTAKGYQVDLAGNELTCYSVTKQGGFLGIGRRTVRKSVLKAVVSEDGVELPSSDVDPAFVDLVLSLLRQH